MTEKDLLGILNDLGPKEFEDFKWALKHEKVGNIPPIQKSKLSEAERRDVVDLMVQKYELAGAVEVFKSILKISRKDLVRKLPNISSGAEEDGVSTEEAQIERQLHKTAGKLTVVLQLGCKHEEGNPLSRLTELTEHRCLMLTDERPAEQLQSYMSASPTHMMRTGNSGSLTHSGNNLNLVLLGMAGTGKSSSGNTILGEKLFFSKYSSKPITKECQVEETVINGTHVRVIDTPDIFDDEIKPSVKNEHVTECKELIQSGPCVYLLVMQMCRLTDGERNILRKLERAFGSKAKDQTVILFTRGEDLQAWDVTLEEFLRSCHPELKNIVEQCGRRCVVFDNEATPQQVTELMQTVNRMLYK